MAPENEFAVAGGSSLKNTPTVPTVRGDFLTSIELTEGISEVAGQQLDSIIPQMFLSKAGRKAVERAGHDTDTAMPLEDIFEILRAEGRNETVFKKPFRKALKEKGFLQAKQLVSPETFEAITTGELADTAEDVQSITDSAFQMALTGQETALEAAEFLRTSPQLQEAMDVVSGGIQAIQAAQSGDFSSPVARDAIRVFEERFGQQLAGRGMAASGEASFMSTVGGVSAAQQALQQQGLTGVQGGLGAAQGIQGIGLGNLQAGFSLASGGQQGIGQFEPFTNPGFALGRSDVQFQRNLFTDLLQSERNQAARAVAKAGDLETQGKAAIVPTFQQTLFELANQGNRQ